MYLATLSLCLFMFLSAFANDPKPEQEFFCESARSHLGYDPADMIEELSCTEVITTSRQQINKVEGLVQLKLNGTAASYHCDFFYTGTNGQEEIIGGVELINCNEL